MSSSRPRVLLGSAPGPVLEVVALGAAVQRLEITCGDGVRRNVVLGASDEERLRDRTYRGATVGRYANRIAHGHLELDGITHRLSTHDRGHLLHGGSDGFDRREWDVVASDPTSVRLRLVSPDGDQGFPGRLVAETAYDLLPDGFRTTLTATTDAPSVVNLTHHGYANLAGEGSGRIDDHRLTVPADLWTPVDDGGIPLGHHEPVDATRFDLRDGPVLGAREIDHNLVVAGKGMRALALLESPTTRTRLEIRSDQPGLQVFTGDTLDPARGGIALEPQLFPDSPHHPDWPSAVLRPGETYRHVLEWRFATGG